MFPSCFLHLAPLDNFNKRTIISKNHEKNGNSGIHDDTSVLKKGFYSLDTFAVFKPIMSDPNMIVTYLLNSDF